MALGLFVAMNGFGASLDSSRAWRDVCEGFATEMAQPGTTGLENTLKGRTVCGCNKSATILLAALRRVCNMSNANHSIGSLSGFMKRGTGTKRGADTV